MKSKLVLFPLSCQGGVLEIPGPVFWWEPLHRTPGLLAAALSSRACPYWAFVLVREDRDRLTSVAGRQIRGRVEGLFGGRQQGVSDRSRCSCFLEFSQACACKLPEIDVCGFMNRSVLCICVNRPLLCVLYSHTLFCERIEDYITSFNTSQKGSSFQMTYPQTEPTTPAC